jgi:hypothetical protein
MGIRFGLGASWLVAVLVGCSSAAEEEPARAAPEALGAGDAYASDRECDGARKCGAVVNGAGYGSWRCVPRDPGEARTACTGQADCDRGLLCKGGRCVLRNGAKCADDEDCNSGRCALPNHVAQLGVCPLSRRCDAGRCLRRYGERRAVASTRIRPCRSWAEPAAPRARPPGA